MSAGGLVSNVKLGAELEQTLLAAVSADRKVCLSRGHPATKMLHGVRGPRLVYTQKNGVDFVGIAWGKSVAIECKRLPNAASLSAAKDSSTAAEARFLHEFAQAGGRSAFLVLDDTRGRLYVVPGYRALLVFGPGGLPLRDRAGVAQVPCVGFGGAPGAQILAVRTALEQFVVGDAGGWVLG